MARRLGAEDSETRGAIIARTVALVNDEGYAAVTAGRIARELGLSRHSVHYYFGTIEDLFVAVIRHEAEEARAWYERLVDSPFPLRTFWNRQCSSEPKNVEYLLLAYKSPAIAAEFREASEMLRRMLANAVEAHLERQGLKSNVPPVAVALTVVGMSRMLTESASLGLIEGQIETQELMTRWIEVFERTGQWSYA